MGFISPNKSVSNIGGGILFPINLVDGKVPIVNDISLIRNSIINTLNWYGKTRFFLGQFNSRLGSLLEEPNDAVLLNIATSKIRFVLETWETRINVLKIEKQSQESDKLNLQILYQVKNTNIIDDSFIYPFYKKIIY